MKPGIGGRVARLLFFVPALGLLPAPGGAAGAGMGPPAFDLAAFKPGWRRRIAAFRESGRLPIIDIESSYAPARFDVRGFAAQMDEHGLALAALSPDFGPEDAGEAWTDHARSLVQADPSRFIPATPGGGYRAFVKEQGRFLDQVFAHVRSDRYPLMGEFFFRHYPSVRQAAKGQGESDVSVPLDGPAGRRLFAFAEQSGVPFQIHYEVEDWLLPALERMLRDYPRAKVVWCHLAQVRYSRRGARYGPEYVRRLIKTHPNIHFDLAVPEPARLYPQSLERQSRIWDQATGRLDARWRQLIIDHPWRFHAALDLGGDRMEMFEPKLARQKRLLEELPLAAREIVAYRATWKLLFGEDFDAEGGR